MAGNWALLGLENGIKINWIFSNVKMLELELWRQLSTLVGGIIKNYLPKRGNPIYYTFVKILDWTSEITA